jgi:hypothetical protein
LPGRSQVNPGFIEVSQNPVFKLLLTMTMKVLSVFAEGWNGHLFSELIKFQEGS